MEDNGTDGAAAGEETAAGAELNPQGGEGGPKGEPDYKAQSARLTKERDEWKQKAETAEGQLKTLNESLAKALTEEDVKAAVEKAQADAKKASDEAEAAWKEREKRLVVENELVKAGCSDTVGLLAHLDLGKIEVASDGHVAGLDVAKAKESYPHLFGTSNVVSSAATPNGPRKKMTKEEIMGVKDPVECRRLIAQNMDLFES